MQFNSDESEGLFFGLRGMTYQLEGSITVKEDETIATYDTTAYKSWNFDPHEELFGQSFVGPANAAGWGYAQEFAVISQSRWDTVTW